MDHLDSQDVVTFTGSATTGQMLRVQPNIVAESIPFTMEAGFPELLRTGRRCHPRSTGVCAVIREVVREMTTKAGQKCTAIRRIIAAASIG
ncbi:hypothetical protein OIU92_28860 [Escherichia coli]|nr:hypothetical protein [Escherichia coli]